MKWNANLGSDLLQYRMTEIRLLADKNGIKIMIRWKEEEKAPWGFHLNDNNYNNTKSEKEDYSDINSPESYKELMSKYLITGCLWKAGN